MWGWPWAVLPGQSSAWGPLTGCLALSDPSPTALFCDYYNPQGWCQWHYQPCGAPCLKTCRNPSGQCWHDTQGLEGGRPAGLGRGGVCPGDPGTVDQAGLPWAPQGAFVAVASSSPLPGG